MPKCGVEMEPIEMSAEGLAVQELQLCPSCYLATWTDQDGPHDRRYTVRPGENPDNRATGSEAQVAAWRTRGMLSAGDF